MSKGGRKDRWKGGGKGAYKQKEGKEEERMKSASKNILDVALRYR